MSGLLVHTVAGGQLAAGTDQRKDAWLQLTAPDGELPRAVEALVLVYADVCGARRASFACGVNRTLRNRARAAQEEKREREIRRLLRDAQRDAQLASPHSAEGARRRARVGELERKLAEFRP